MKVALVDDSPEVRDVMTRLLRKIEGVQVAGVAEDVSGALAMIDAAEPDIVVLDIELRDQERGIDVLRHLTRERPDVDVVVLSNYGWGAMRDAFLEAGARAYFDKAFEFDRAIHWIRTRNAQAASGPRAATS